ncbi:hypothetical protein CSOJ01_00862 [Colletotrichum sojae]|uniref:Uncharacterized protein n=1 Tax=Colletotrichum sojae TaxID=2175907 RepID=A0A8H6N4N7_9PEZI|nr:hypothetical protein CSOJ01_00862 [Colletotrichum sojae]
MIVLRISMATVPVCCELLVEDEEIRIPRRNMDMTGTAKEQDEASRARLSNLDSGHLTRLDALQGTMPEAVRARPERPSEDIGAVKLIPGPFTPSEVADEPGLHSPLSSLVAVQAIYSGCLAAFFPRTFRHKRARSEASQAVRNRHREAATEWQVTCHNRDFGGTGVLRVPYADVKL